MFIALAPATVVAAGSALDKGGDVTGRNMLPATTSETWLASMLEAGRNGAAFKDPEVFAEWLDAITEPRFMTALATMAVDPALDPKAIPGAIDPAATRNWSEFTDPQLYLRWMLAASTPSFQQAIIRKMTDSGKMKRWVEAAKRPDPQAPLLAGFCRLPAAWIRFPLKSDTYAPMLETAVPVTPLAGGVDQRISGAEWLKLPVEKNAGWAASSGARYRY